MPTLRVPLVGVHNERGVDGTNAIIIGQDQRFLNCIFDLVKNPITGKSTFYVEKRPGWQQNTIVSAGNISTGLLKTDILNSIVSAFGTPNSTIFDGQTSVGTISGEAIHLSETTLPPIGHVMIRSSDGTGWYYPSNAKTQTTYTGTTTAGNVQIDAITAGTGTAGIYSGQLLTSANITAGTRVSTIISTTQITMNATASGSGNAAFTKEPVAKILSANFVTTGTNLSAFTDLDGYVVYCMEDGYVYNSDLNSVSLYTASNKIAAQISADLPVAIARYKQYIICFGQASTEFFHNAGNPVGSPLNSDEQLFKRVGIQNQRSLTQIEDDIYFVSSSRDGDIHVKRLSYLQITDISTSAVEKILGTANAQGNAIYVNGFTLGGYSYLLLQVLQTSVLPTTNYFLLAEDGSYILLEDGSKIILDSGTQTATALSSELVYNIDLNIWSEWDSPLLTFVRGIGAGSINQIIATSRISTSGKIYDINPSAEMESFTDDGTPYSMQIQTSKLDFGTDNRKSIKQLSIIGDQQTSGSVLVEYSDDDYQSWQTWGTIDTSQKVQNLTRGGSHKGGRAYRFTDSGDNPFRAQAFEIDYTVDTQ